MPSQSFFTMSKDNAGEVTIKRLSLNAETQTNLVGMFRQQENDFRSGIEEEVEFNGDYNCDPEEVLFVEASPYADLLLQTLDRNPQSVEVLDIENLDQESIKAIFSGHKVRGNWVIQIQGFSARQLLEHKFSLIFQNNVLNELTAPVFTLDTKLVGIIEDNKIKFKKFHNIKMIFDLSNIYREATDEDIEQFASHDVLLISDVSDFKTTVDQTSRKLVHALQKNDVLSRHDAQQIKRRAQSVNISITIENGKVKMPSSRAEIKRLLQFLHDDVYEAPLSGTHYISNSKKAA